MSQLICILKTELYQLLTDKKLLTTIIILTFMLFLFIFSSASMEFWNQTNSDFSINNLRDDLLNVEYNLFIFIFCVLCYGMPILIVSDITTGEKERNTLESLLLTNCSRRIILYGKCLVTLIFSLFPFVIGYVFLVGLIFLFPTPLKTFNEMLMLALIIIPYSLMISLLLLYNGLVAKTIRSAKSQEQKILVLIPIVCLGLSMIVNAVSLVVYYILISCFIWFLHSKSLKYIQSERLILK